MGRNEFANLGDEIKDAVQSAINKGDFAKLRAEIGDSVNQAFDEIKQSLQGTTGENQPGSLVRRRGKTRRGEPTLRQPALPVLPAEGCPTREEAAYVPGQR